MTTTTATITNSTKMWVRSRGIRLWSAFVFLSAAAYVTSGESLACIEVHQVISRQLSENYDPGQLRMSPRASVRKRVRYNACHCPISSISKWLVSIHFLNFYLHFLHVYSLKLY